METYILAACFFTSIVANLLLMGALVARRQRTTLEFAGKNLQVHLHQGNVHLITGLVLYEKGRQGEAIAMLQEAVRQDPQDRMAEAMLEIALHAGGHGVKGLPPGQPRQRLPGRAGADADGIIDAVIHDVPPGAAQLAAPAAALDSGGLANDLIDDVDADLAAAVRAGLALLNRGETAAALGHFETLTRAHPASRIARTGQAIALKHAGRDDEAAEVLRQTLSATGTAAESQPPDSVNTPSDMAP
jgi:Flp pilus assembly protein TadD